MFLIERLWIDTLENRDAYGFTAIGVVPSKSDADRIATMEMVKKSDYPWPLKYATEFEGPCVPRFKATEMKDLSGFTIDQLKNV